MLNKAQLDELIADLGYALLHLKNVPYSADQNRTRELVSKVGDALIKERKKMPGKPNGRAWVDQRRLDCVALAATHNSLMLLDKDQINQLYDITVAEHENWDGEEVSTVQLVKCMIARYGAAKLTPSRN